MQENIFSGVLFVSGVLFALFALVFYMQFVESSLNVVILLWVTAFLQQKGWDKRPLWQKLRRGAKEGLNYFYVI